MSYSFTTRATSKDEAKANAAQQFANVLATQPSHKADIEHVQKATEAFVDALADDAERDVVVSVHGSVSGQWDGAEVQLSDVRTSISVVLSQRAITA